MRQDSYLRNSDSIIQVEEFCNYCSYLVDCKLPATYTSHYLQISCSPANLNRFCFEKENFDFKVLLVCCSN